MLKLKNSLTMRGDSLYCPLSLSLDSYGNCLTDCRHCYMRNLNHIWGNDLKPADLNLLKKKLTFGLINKHPITPISFALSQKKTIRWGNKTDPFQKAEKKHQIAKGIFSILIELNWTFVIQTRFTEIMLEYENWIQESHIKKLITIMPVISPGIEKDWEIFERKRTTNPINRLKHANYLKKKGIPIGINGEPFIPGFHNETDFEQILKLLRKYNINRYNTYNFHFNAFVAKRLHAIGIDIEKIWYYNQDRQWKKILSKLLDLSKKYNIILGCPDFVNSGMKWVEKANTCCGIDVPNPCTFNSHYFKKWKQQRKIDDEIIRLTYDGTGKLEDGIAMVKGTSEDKYTLKDILK